MCRLTRLQAQQAKGSWRGDEGGHKGITGCEMQEIESKESTAANDLPEAGPVPVRARSPEE